MTHAEMLRSWAKDYDTDSVLREALLAGAEALEKQEEAEVPIYVVDPSQVYMPDIIAATGAVGKIVRLRKQYWHWERAELMKQLAEAREALERETWRPIETAPKDGTRLLLCRVARTQDNPTYRIWWCTQGWWSERFNIWFDGVEPSGLASPTHWRPLPEPPKECE